MSIITLISDFGLKDHYVSAVKAAIYSKSPAANVIDISHDIEKFNLQGAAFVLQQAYTNFPPKTVHIIGLNSEYAPENGYVLVEFNDHFFISADNGIFSLLFEEMPSKVFQINLPENLNLSFVVRDLFVPLACKLIGGQDIESHLTPKANLLQRLPFRATSMGDIIKGAIVFIDSYDNAILNIDKNLFDRACAGRPFVIEFGKGYQINKISNGYNTVREGDLLAMFNSSNNLELAMRDGKLSSLLGLNLNTQITIHFS